MRGEDEESERQGPGIKVADYHVMCRLLPPAVLTSLSSHPFFSTSLNRYGIDLVLINTFDLKLPYL